MMISDIPLIGLMKTKMAYLSQRQSVLASNVANADTPGAKPHDLVSPPFADLVADVSNNLRMRATNPMHYPQKGMGLTNRFDGMTQRHTFETTPTGNSIVLEEEMVKVSQTQAEYNLMTNSYRKTMDLFRSALGRN